MGGVLWPVLAELGYRPPDGKVPVLLGKSRSRHDFEPLYSETYLANSDAVGGNSAVKCVRSGDVSEAVIFQNLQARHLAAKEKEIPKGLNVFPRVYLAFEHKHGNQKYAIILREAFPNKRDLTSSEFKIHTVTASDYRNSGRAILDGMLLLHDEGLSLIDYAPGNRLSNLDGADPKLIDTRAQRYDLNARVSEKTKGFSLPHSDAPCEQRMAYGFLATEFYGARKLGLSKDSLMSEVGARLREWTGDQARALSLSEIARMYDEKIEAEESLVRRAKIGRRVFISLSYSVVAAAAFEASRRTYESRLENIASQRTPAQKVADLVQEGYYEYDEERNTVPVGFRRNANVSENEITIEGGLSTQLAVGFVELLLAAAEQESKVTTTALNYAKKLGQQMLRASPIPGSSENLFGLPLLRAYKLSGDASFLKPLVNSADFLINARSQEGTPIFAEFPGGWRLAYERQALPSLRSGSIDSADTHGLSVLMAGARAARTMGDQKSENEFIDAARKVADTLNKLIVDGQLYRHGSINSAAIQIISPLSAGAPVHRLQIQHAQNLWELANLTEQEKYTELSYELSNYFMNNFPKTIGYGSDKSLEFAHQMPDVYAAALILKLAAAQNREGEFQKISDALSEGVDVEGTISSLEFNPEVKGFLPKLKHKRKSILQGVTLAQPDTRQYGIDLINVSLSCADAAIVDSSLAVVFTPRRGQR